MGGALTFASVALIPEEISAAAPFYAGILKPDLCDLGQIKRGIPLRDSLLLLKDAKAMAEKFDVGRVTYELFMYDTGHAFTNPSHKNYTKEICDLALGRMIDFMKKHLK